MSALRQFIARMRALVAGSDLDRDFADEMKAHLEFATEENVRRGMMRAEARRQASLRLGATTSLASQHRDARGFRPLEEIGQDIRFAARLTIKDKWLSAAIAGVLALGIGANTFGFAVVNAAFWRGLPVDGSDQLVMISWINENGRRQPASHTELLEWRQATQLEDAAGYQESGASLSDDVAAPDRIHKTRVTTNTFALLRTHPFLGRDFIASDGMVGATPVAIISDQLWRRRYESVASIIGESIRIDGAPATVIGVMADGMLFPDRTDVWVPFVPSAAEHARDRRPFDVIARLAGSADRRRMRAELDAIAAAQLSAYPAETDGLSSIRVETVAENAIGGLGRRLIRIIMVATSFVLLIATANVVILLLLRSGVRAREMALRAAIGATRWRLLRQLLIESLLLSIVGAAAGLGVATVAIRLFAIALGGSMPYWVMFTLDYRASAYAAAIAVLTAAVFGIAPLVSLTRGHATETIHDGGRGTIGVVRVRRLTAALVVAELSIAIALLGGAGLLARSLASIYNPDLGVDTRPLVAMTMTLPQSRYTTADSRSRFAARVQSAMSAIGGVESATVTTGVPSRDGGERLMEIEGGDRRDPVFVSTIAITPTYFDTLGLALRRGRGFDDLDGAQGSDVAIINSRLASQFFPGQDPIGRRLRFTFRRFAPGQTPGAWRTIVGVAPDISHGSPNDGYLNAAVYVPYRELAPPSVSVLLRTSLAPQSIMIEARQQLQQLDADLPIAGPQTIDDLLQEDRWPYRLYGLVFATFAAIAVVLSIAATYAVMAFTVERRRAEFGVRSALGAGTPALLWLALRSALRHITAAVVIGVGGAIATGRALEGMLIGVTAGDPITLAGVAAVLSAIAFIACLLPALRAARVDPAIVLRVE